MKPKENTIHYDIVHTHALHMEKRLYKNALIRKLSGTAVSMATRKWNTKSAP